MVFTVVSDVGSDVEDVDGEGANDEASEDEGSGDVGKAMLETGSGML